MPVAVVIMSFASADDASTAVLLLHLRGFDAGSVACYTTAQMRRPGPLGTWGLSPHFIAALRDLGLRGYSVVAARTAQALMVEHAGLIAREAGATTALHHEGCRVANLLQPLRRVPLAMPATASSVPPDRWRTAAHPSTVP